MRVRSEYLPSVFNKYRRDSARLVEAVLYGNLLTTAWSEDCNDQHYAACKRNDIDISLSYRK